MKYKIGRLWVIKLQKENAIHNMHLLLCRFTKKYSRKDGNFVAFPRHSKKYLKYGLHIKLSIKFGSKVWKGCYKQLPVHFPLFSAKSRFLIVSSSRFDCQQLFSTYKKFFLLVFSQSSRFAFLFVSLKFDCFSTSPWKQFCFL